MCVNIYIYMSARARVCVLLRFISSLVITSIGELLDQFRMDEAGVFQYILTRFLQLESFPSHKLAALPRLKNLVCPVI